MAGIYVHIPFCRSRCIYCDFYSTTREEEKEAYVRALCKEIAARRHELQGERVRTIYIGGGTPSLLSTRELGKILDCIHEHFVVEAGAEVTMEMNPDDVGKRELNNGVNRISLGIQTFDDGLLRLLRRRHDSAEAVQAVKTLQEAGIGNISIDLIYGLPGQTKAQWEADLQLAFSLGIQHLSAYSLSYEEGTLLSRWRQEGRVTEVTDELSVEMYQRLCLRAAEAGFEHYEISNFALPGYASRHNSNYWTGEAYLGFGPGAHSYDGRRTRRANRADLSAYMAEETMDSCAISEELTDDELFDEAVMCGLRTRRGINMESIGQRFGQTRLEGLLRMARPHLQASRLVIEDGHLHLTQQSLMTSDDIMSDLMAV